MKGASRITTTPVYYLSLVPPPIINLALQRITYILSLSFSQIMADPSPTNDASPGKNTVKQYLPGEMLNLIAARVPQEVYDVLNIFSPTRNGQRWTGDDKDMVKTIGTFKTLELANTAAESFVKHKVKPMLLTEGRLEGTKKKTFSDGTIRWRLIPHRPDFSCTVMTQKCLVCETVWNEQEMPLPLHGDMVHNSRCRCCNTAEEIEARKKARLQAEKRRVQREKKRKMVKISKQLKELEKDKTLERVDLGEETEEDTDDFEITLHLENESESGSGEESEFEEV